MKCNILLKEAINGSIVSPEERVALKGAEMGCKNKRPKK